MLQRLSLTVRLALFFTLVAAVLVLGLGAVFMAAADRHFIDLDRSTLIDKKHLVEEVLTESNSLEEARWQLGQALSHHHGLFVSVKDANNITLFESNGFFKPSIVEEKQGLLVWRNNGREYRAIRAEVIPPHLPATPFAVTIAMDTEHHQHFLSNLQGKLAIYALLATVVSGMLGWWAAHQGMAPLRAMKMQAAGVSGKKLETRMQVESVPIEMASLARELNQMLDRLQNDFRRLSEFSSDLAHEFRTPISNLLTQTQVALSSKRDANTYRDILASNVEEFQRLARMVSDMLFLAKTERGVDLPNKESFSAAHEVRALLEFYEALAEEKRIHLSFSGDGKVQGDRLMFCRAVSNLLSNALRHTPEDGEVHIFIAETPQATEVTVENTGSQIPPKALPRLFDRFYRADAARAHPSSEGAGLGLSITKAIVEAHGGSVLVQSSQDKTQFSLKFPR